MKRFFIEFMMLFVSISIFAQTINFRTTSFCYRERTQYGWTSFSTPESSDMLLTMDMSNDIVRIYSPTMQIYKVYAADTPHVDKDGDTVWTLKFVDQDGDYGTMQLMQRTNGISEVYIKFSNIVWVYRVIRI